MSPKRAPLMVSVLVLAGCSGAGSGRTATAAAPRPQIESAEDRNAARAHKERDGSTLEDAIEILESTEGAGARAERRWLQDAYPGCTKLRGAVLAENGRHYDVVVIRLRDGTEKTLNFDITAFYGFN